jgi:hypothetical protein
VRSGVNFLENMLMKLIQLTAVLPLAATLALPATAAGPSSLVPIETQQACDALDAVEGHLDSGVVKIWNSGFAQPQGGGICFLVIQTPDGHASGAQ